MNPSLERLGAPSPQPSPEHVPGPMPSDHLEPHPQASKATKHHGKKGQKKASLGHQKGSASVPHVDPSVIRQHTDHGHADPARTIEWVLSGSTVVKSYAGTSQYQQRGLSACTLASLEAVRQVLSLEGDGTTGVDLLRHMTKREAADVISLISSSFE